MAENRKKKYDLETYSGAVDAYLAKKNSVGAYDDKYGTEIKNSFSALKNDKFSYDPAADNNAQTQVKALRTSAQRGMKDTMGRAAQLTGGYNNSYAQTAAQQVYDQTMSQVDDIYAAAREQARAEWLDERNDRYNQLSVLGDMSDRDYGRWADERSRADAEADTYLSIAESNRDREYQAKRDAEADRQWQTAFDYNKEQDALARETAADQWAQEMAYQRERDAVEDARWQQEFDEDQRRYDQDYAADIAAAGVKTEEDTKASLYTFAGVNEDGRSVFYRDGKEYTFEYGINPYTGTKNPDAEKGTFNNGYQPNNVDGSPLHHYTKVDEKGKEYAVTDVLHGKRQYVWQDEKEGKLWYWNGAENAYDSYNDEE